MPEPLSPVQPLMPQAWVVARNATRVERVVKNFIFDRCGAVSDFWSVCRWRFILYDFLKEMLLLMVLVEKEGSSSSLYSHTSLLSWSVIYSNLSYQES